VFSDKSQTNFHFVNVKWEGTQKRRLYRDRLGREWRAFYEKELLTLCEDDDFVRAVATAAVFPNPDVAGCVAEEQLDEILGKGYAAMESRAYVQKALNKFGPESMDADK
jgi:hypothetical protein